MRRVATILVMCGVALAAPPLARAQESVIEDDRLASVRDRLDATLDAARREGFPPEWLIDKIAEGLSKRVPPPRIAAAVDALLARIRTADALVESVPGPARRRLVRAAADALAAGAPPAELGELVREVARGERASDRAYEALTTVAELAERQFAGAVAVQATRDAYRRGVGPRELLRRARRIGRDPPGGRDHALRELGRGRGHPPGRTGAPGRGHGRDHPGRGHGRR